MVFVPPLRGCLRSPQHKNDDHDDLEPRWWFNPSEDKRIQNEHHTRGGCEKKCKNEINTYVGHLSHGSFRKLFGAFLSTLTNCKMKDWKTSGWGGTKYFPISFEKSSLFQYKQKYKQLFWSRLLSSHLPYSYCGVLSNHRNLKSKNKPYILESMAPDIAKYWRDWCFKLVTLNTVDGRNPAPPGMYKTL